METVNDIIRELREYSDRGRGREWMPLADRLDAAYKRDLQSIVDAGEIDMRTAMDEIAKLRKTNEVLECARNLWFERAQELKKRCDELYNGGEA